MSSFFYFLKWLGMCLILNLWSYSIVVDAAHPWAKEGGDASDIPLDISVLSNMREFVKYSRLKQLALRVNDPQSHWFLFCFGLSDTIQTKQSLSGMQVMIYNFSKHLIFRLWQVLLTAPKSQTCETSLMRLTWIEMAQSHSRKCEL